MKKFWFLPAFAALSALFFSCVIPEKFALDINIAKDGTYTVSGKGTLVSTSVFASIRDQGSVSAETDSSIQSYFDSAVNKEPAI